MTDGVSFDQHGPGQHRPRRKGPNLLLIMLIAFGAFTLMQRMKAKPTASDGRPTAPGDANGELGRPPYDFEQQQRPQQTSRQQPTGRNATAESNNSDWSLEEVDIRRPQDDTARPEAKKTERGDWTLEEVE